MSCKLTFQAGGAGGWSFIPATSRPSAVPHACIWKRSLAGRPFRLGESATRCTVVQQSWPSRFYRSHGQGQHVGKSTALDYMVIWCHSCLRNADRRVRDRRFSWPSCLLWSGEVRLCDRSEEHTRSTRSLAQYARLNPRASSTNWKSSYSASVSAILCRP